MSNLAKQTIKVDLALDTLPLSSDAFRVYFHLFRVFTAAQNGGYQRQIWLTYQKVGDHCFPSSKIQTTRKNKAIRAIRELRKCNLIQVGGILEDQDSYAWLDGSKWQIFSVEASRFNAQEEQGGAE